ncbi:MAG: hypothetical protein ACHQD9_09610, partial [Chitinophagales bacterium]
PSAYFRFAVLLLLLIAANIALIAFLFPDLKSVNETAVKSIVLIVPWLLLLVLPSVILGIFVYRSFVKRYKFSFQDEENNSDHKRLVISLLNKKGETHLTKEFSSSEIKSINIIDFEDNHYCNIKFTERKNDLVIHRESGDFENFFQALMLLAPDAFEVHD